MANLTILYDDELDNAVLSGGSWSTDLPLSNLQNSDIGEVARSTDATTGSTVIDADFATADDPTPTIEAVVLGPSNISRLGFSPAASWQVRLYENSTAANRADLLLHFDGTDASTTITDSSGSNHVFTAVGNAQLDTAQFKFGTASLLLDGDDYLQGDGSDDFAFGTLDFTIDCWVRFNALGVQRSLYDSRPSGAAVGQYVYIYKDTDDKIKLIVDGGVRITGTTVVTTGTWYHVALTRASGSTRLFLNGTQEGSTYTDTNTYINGANAPFIGAAVNGWIDELRVIKGTALWAANFTPPTGAATGSLLYNSGSLSILSVETSLPLYLYHVLTNAVTTATYARINIVDTGNADGYVQIGRLLFLKSFTPSVNYSEDNSFSFEPITDVVESFTGRRFFLDRGIRRRLSVAFPMLTETEIFDEVITVSIKSGTSGQVFVIPNTADSTYAGRRNFLATMTRVPAIRQLLVELGSTAFEFEEVL